MILRLEDQMRFRGLGENKFPLQVLIKPKRPGNGVLGCESVVHMRCERIVYVLTGNQSPRTIGVIHNAMEVVRRPSHNNGEAINGA